MVSVILPLHRICRMIVTSRSATNYQCPRPDTIIKEGFCARLSRAARSRSWCTVHPRLGMGDVLSVGVFLLIRIFVTDSLSRYLSDTSNREIYESAHSVILAILASHTLPANPDISDVSGDFVTRIIPFYAQCLIEASNFLYSWLARLTLSFVEFGRRKVKHGTTSTGILCPRAKRGKPQ